MLRRLLASVAIAAVLAAPAAAQHAPERPELPRGADPNDWEAYYDLGVAKLNSKLGRDAEAAFYWSARLEPQRAEPLYGVRAALFMKDLTLWERYLEDDARALRSPVALRADSLLRESLLRNPFVAPTLDVLLIDQLPGYWGQDRTTQGWLHFARGNLGQAARHFRAVIESNPRSNYRRRYDLATVQVIMGEMDSAAVQIQALLDELRRRDEQRVVVYQSKEMLEYALGLLHMARRRWPEARAAMERAVLENAGGYLGHRGLASIAQAEGKAAEAVEEYRQAVALGGEHPLLEYEFGHALLRAGAVEEAVEHLGRAVAREPYWADARLELGRAYEAAGKTAEALEAYERYTRLAPRKAAATVQAVRQRIERLRAAPPPAQ
jgi:tetratricopeptide (TPR) repeat protein